jgi:PAS domain-containing protein
MTSLVASVKCQGDSVRRRGRASTLRHSEPGGEAVSHTVDSWSATDASRTSALLDALYGSAPVGLGFWDRELRYVRVNEALARINDRAAEDHVGRTLAEVVPQLAHVLEPIVRRVLERGEPVVALEMTGGTPADPGTLR